LVQGAYGISKPIALRFFSVLQIDREAFIVTIYKFVWCHGSPVNINNFFDLLSLKLMILCLLLGLCIQIFYNLIFH